VASTVPAMRHSRSGDDVRGQLVFNEGDAVAQEKLALLQPLNLQDIRSEGVLEGFDCGIEVAVLLEQARQSGPELAFFLLCHTKIAVSAEPSGPEHAARFMEYRPFYARASSRGTCC